MPPPDPAARSHSAEAALALLEWQIAMGADEAIDAVAPDRFAPPAAAPSLARSTAPQAEPSEPRPAPPRMPVAIAPPAGLADSLAEAAGRADRGGGHDGGFDGAVDPALMGALLGLPARQRQVVALRIFLDLDTARTAQTLGIAPGTVTAHLARAIATLREELSGALEQEQR